MASSDEITTAATAIALPSASTSTSRRLPPPCWSPEETAALIDAYRDKWYSLRRGNLKAAHWQEVADAVAARSPAIPPKTPVQCRHKMEKLRKRYRSELQRAAASPAGPRRFSSSWPHFPSMYSMDKGPNPPNSSNSPNSSPSPSSSDEFTTPAVKPINDFYNSAAASAFRIKIPGRVPTAARNYSKFDKIGGGNLNNPNPRFTNYAAPNRDNLGLGQIGKRGNGGDGLIELVAAIHNLGEGFMRMEKAKMDMVQQIEEMRMEMELKRTEMLLDSEQRIVEGFAQAVAERSAKRAKRNSTTHD